MAINLFFTARQFNWVEETPEEVLHDVGYLGIKKRGENFSWEKKIDVNTSLINYHPSPCRIVPKDSGLRLLMMGLDEHGSFGDPIPRGIQITGHDPASEQESAWLSYLGNSYNIPNNEDFAADGDRIVIVIKADMVYSVGYPGFTLRRSTDYGKTFSEPYVLDCLKDLLGDDYAYFTYGYPDEHSIQKDQVTGKFWIAMSYGPPQFTGPYRLNNNFLIVYSDDGLTWTISKDFGLFQSGTYWEGTTVGLAASSGKIYLVHYLWNGSVDSIVMDYSLDNGDTWESSSIVPPGEIFDLMGRVVANGSTVLVYAYINYNGFVLFRSTDCITWTPVLSLHDDNWNYDGWQYYMSMRNYGNTCIVTYDYLKYPYNGIVYWGTDEVVHSLDGVGDSHLGFFMSTDNFLTWEFFVTPIITVDESAWEEAANILGWVHQTVDVYISADGGPRYIFSKFLRKLSLTGLIPMKEVDETEPSNYG